MVARAVVAASSLDHCRDLNPLQSATGSRERMNGARESSLNCAASKNLSFFYWGEGGVLTFIFV